MTQMETATRSASVEGGGGLAGGAATRTATQAPSGHALTLPRWSAALSGVRVEGHSAFTRRKTYR
ncbi:hypothetical protein GCM10022380_25030 [Amycolatopsis tucumanensis]|uniref:Uncharacterized protein n=1 Tax=Amycolatopsis tucumanensis TaxID=401106 RepID=A0ABP7I1F2_9PSEU